MMRSLWTSVSGMTSQMLSIDNITNNLANVNTTGFKKERVEFKTLMYETMKRADLDPANQTGQPANLQVGLGVRPVATTRLFSQGSLQSTGNNLDVALQGEGFFAVARGLDEVVFTRDGSFKFMTTGDDEFMLTTAQGFPVLDDNGEALLFPPGTLSSSVVVNETGEVFYTAEEMVEEYGTMMEVEIPLGQRLQIAQFPNQQALLSEGGGYYTVTPAAGEAILPLSDGGGRAVDILQNYLEMSTVNVAEEMVNMVTTQRAFDMNSKGITTSDEMLQTANNLKRA